MKKILIIFLCLLMNYQILGKNPFDSQSNKALKEVEKILNMPKYANITLTKEELTKFQQGISPSSSMDLFSFGRTLSGMLLDIYNAISSTILKAQNLDFVNKKYKTGFKTDNQAKFAKKVIALINKKKKK